MKGTIIYYNPRRYFGFIATDQGEEYFFFHQNTSRRSDRHTIRIGDAVTFDVQPSEMKEGRLEATIFSFDGNERWSFFVDDVRLRPFRSGYLKRIDQSWYIKVMPEKFMIRLDGISRFEIDIEVVYDLRENQLVPADLTVNKKGEVTAILEDRKMLPTYHQAEIAKKSGAQLQARITGGNDHVYFATLFEGKLPVVVRRKSLPEGVTYSKGNVVEVLVTSISDTNIAVLPPAYINAVV